MSSKKNGEYLFVYGTLRKMVDHSMSDLLQKYSRHIGRATFQGKLFDVGTYPAAISSNVRSDTVHGELYAIIDPDAIFRHLDPYEGYTAHHPSQSLFIRKKVLVNAGNQKGLKVWIYLYNRSTNKLSPIPDGDYIKHLD